MSYENISITQQAETKSNGINNSSFWKNEIIKQLYKSKKESQNRKSIPEKEDEIINDLRKIIQNFAKQAKSYCIYEKNKRTMGFESKEIPQNIQKEITYYKRLEEKRRRLEQTCIWGLKKRSIKNLINGNLLKNLLNQPENNRLQYTSKTSKKIYDVMILNKEITNDKTIYQLETSEGKPFKFAVIIDKNQEDKYFTTSKNTSIIEGLEEIESIIKQFLNKIPG